MEYENIYISLEKIKGQPIFIYYRVFDDSFIYPIHSFYAVSDKNHD